MCLGGQIELFFISGKNNWKCLNQSSIYTFGNGGGSGVQEQWGGVEIRILTHSSGILTYTKGKYLGIMQ